MKITRDNFRDSLFAAIAEWQWYKGRFHLVTFLVEHPEIRSISDLVEALTSEAIEANNEQREKLHESQP
jgi:hypothetical protein